MSFLSFASKRQFGSLDGLRALSILGVVWHHAARGEDLPLAEAGAMGVPLFFAISGFLITTLLLRERSRTGDISLPAFYARRSLRIFPLYYTVLAIYVVAVALFERDAAERDEFFGNLPAFITYTSNWFVVDDGRVIFYFAWSLATEEQFYLVWPSVEKFLGARARHLPVVLALALVALWTAVQTDVVALASGSLERTIITSVAPAICFGVALAHVLHEPRTFRIFAHVLGPKHMSPLLLFATMVMLTSGHIAATIGAFVFMALLVGACAIREDHGLAPLLTWAPLASIGQLSYGIYLLHLLVLNVVERGLARMHISSQVVVFVCALPIVWVVAWLSHRFYESRFMALKARFTR